MIIKLLKDYIKLPELKKRNGKYMGYGKSRLSINGKIPNNIEIESKWYCYDCKTFFMKSFKSIYENEEWCNNCAINPIEKNIVLCLTDEEIRNNYKFLQKPIHISIPGSSILLKDKYPTIYAQIHPTLNGSLDITKLTFSSNIKIWFLCSLHDKCGEHIYQSSPNKRCIGQDCKYCFGKSVCKCQSFLSNSILSEQFYQNLNPEIDPLILTLNSNIKIKWLCKGLESCNNECDKHIWEASINNRINSKTGCPFCAIVSSKVCKCQSVYSNILLRSQFCQELNPHINIMDLRLGSTIKIKWLCKGSKNCTDECIKHIWETSINNRKNGIIGCPFCSTNGSGGNISCCRCKSFMNIPLLRKQFNYKLNSEIDPWIISKGSNIKITWSCNGFNTCTDKCKLHIWVASVSDRKNSGCPFCNGKNKTCYCKSFIHDKLLQVEFDKDLNNNIDPFKISNGSSIKLWWTCSICLFKWKTSIRKRSKNSKTGCPECNKNRTESFGHANLRLYLTNNSISYNGEYKIIEYLPSRRYDFYLNEMKYFLEYDGEQHFIKWQYDNDEEDFFYRQQVDIYKTFIVLIQSFNMIRIQNRNYDDIEKIVNKFLSIKIDKPTLFLDSKVKYSYLFGEINHEYLKVLSGYKYDELVDKMQNFNHNVIYYEDL
jgi:very-short-patch-repair endonuclease